MKQIKKPFPSIPENGFKYIYFKLLKKLAVELLSELALLSCSLVLVHDTLSASLVNLLDSKLDSFRGLLSVSSLDNSLKVGLNHLVLKCLSVDNLYSLLSGFNIPLPVFEQKAAFSLGLSVAKIHFPERDFQRYF